MSEVIKLTLSEFEKKYYLHDSSIEKIIYDEENKNLILEIEFCFWMQNWYSKNEPSNGKISVSFKNVSVFEYHHHDFENILENLDTEVRQTEISDERLKIYIYEYNEIEDSFWWIEIKAENIEVTELE